MIPLISRKTEPGEIPWFEYEGRDFFKLFAGAAFPIDEESGAMVVIGETFEKVPGMGRLTLELLFENPRLSLEDFSKDRMEEFKRSYLLKEIWGDPREGLTEIPRVHGDRIKTVEEVLSFIEPVLARKILKLDKQRSELPGILSRLKSAKGSFRQSPLLAAWFYVFAVADVFQTALYQESSSRAEIQQVALKDWDEFNL
jgi:hypothetical protein